MVLEQFIIDADIIWDQVGKTFFENPEAKPGRIMRVQVVNAGIIEDLTGYTLNLGWTSVRDPSKFGLDAFDDVDITKGIFEIEYTSGMLTNVGPLNASLQLVPPGEGRPIESNNFKLTVKNSAINPEAIQGETSFKALENALVEVNGWNTRIDVVEQDFKDRADALDGAYPVRLTAAEQSVAAVEAQVDLLNRGLGETMPTMVSLLAAYPTGDTRDHIVAGNIAEVDTLTITGVPTTAGNVTVTLNGVAVNVPVTVGVAEVASLVVSAVPTVAGNVTVNLNGTAVTVVVDPAVETTTDLVAAKIRATVFTGWTTGGTASTVTFTANTVGTKTDATYSAGTTGATGTMTTTTQGVAAATTTTVATAIRSASYPGWTTGGTGSIVTFTATTVGTRTGPVFSGGTTGTTGTFVRTAIGEAANFHRYFWNGSAWTDGGAYQAFEVLDKTISAEKTTFIDLDKSINFVDIDAASWISGILTSGGTTPDTNYRTSPLIKLPAGNYAYTANSTVYGTANASVIKMYDPSGTQVVGNVIATLGDNLNTALYYSGKVGRFTLANEAYIRFNIGQVGIFSSYKRATLVAGDSLPNTYIGYYVKKSLSSDVSVILSDDEKQKILDTIIEAHEPINLYNVGYTNGYTTASAVIANNSYRVTEKQELDAGNYLFKLFGASLYGGSGGDVRGYDSETEVSIASLYAAKIAEDLDANTRIYSVAIPYKMKVQINIGTSDSHVGMFMIVKGLLATDFPSEYHPYVEPYMAIVPQVKMSEAMSAQVDAKMAELGSVESITVANSSKIGAFSNSFLNGYTMKTKHPLNVLGMWSDYIYYNYGRSGDDLLELLGRIDGDEVWLGDVNPSEYGLTYGLIAMQDNDGALMAAAKDSYYENGKKLALAIKSLGAIPILGTEHDWNSYYYAFNRLAQDMGVMMMNWGKLASKFPAYTPFWHSGHPATRTHWMWAYGMKQFLDTLPRPRKAIKIFRLRPDVTYTQVNELVHNTNIERSKLFSELLVGSSVLSDATEKYFDRLQSATSHITQKDEYQVLHAKSGALMMGDTMLVEIITPFDSNGLEYLNINFEATGVTNVYVKKNLGLQNPLPTTRYVAFGISEGSELLTPNSTFTIEGGVFSSTLLGTYTVEGVINGIVVTKTSSSGKVTSGTDTPTSNINGVIFTGSYDYPSAEYLLRYKEPLAEYVELVAVEGTINMSDFSGCMDFDKLSLLFTGDNILLSDISANVSGRGEKLMDSRPLVTRKKGTNLLNNKLLDSSSSWIDFGKTTAVLPITDGTYTEVFPSGVTAARRLYEGDTVSQVILTAPIDAVDVYDIPRLQIRVLARYFPKYVLSDIDFETTEIYPYSYDCATMAIKIGNQKIGETEVGLWWNEFIFETDYIQYGDLGIECINKHFDIARVECVLI